MIENEDQATIFEKSRHYTTGIDAEGDKSVLIYPFNQYNIRVKIDSDGRILGIVGVGIKKEFLSALQKMQQIQSIGYLDLSEKYPEGSEEDQ
ncbi:MAG TPA: hypothetical protein VMY43_02820 [Methanothrix sp.]|nr:hypothetical protein [Methanothrix sp.]